MNWGFNPHPDNSNPGNSIDPPSGMSGYRPGNHAAICKQKSDLINISINIFIAIPIHLN